MKRNILVFALLVGLVASACTQNTAPEGFVRIKVAQKVPDTQNA